LNGDLRGHFAIRIQAISNDREGVISWILSNSGQKWNSEHLQIFRTIRIRDFLFHIKNLVFVFEEAQKDVDSQALKSMIFTIFLIWAFDNLLKTV
jgi:hypothetical protein